MCCLKPRLIHKPQIIILKWLELGKHAQKAFDALNDWYVGVTGPEVKPRKKDSMATKAKLLMKSGTGSLKAKLSKGLSKSLTSSLTSLGKKFKSKKSFFKKSKKKSASSDREEGVREPSQLKRVLSQACFSSGDKVDDFKRKGRGSNSSEMLDATAIRSSEGGHDESDAEPEHMWRKEVVLESTTGEEVLYRLEKMFTITAAGQGGGEDLGLYVHSGGTCDGQVTLLRVHHRKFVVSDEHTDEGEKFSAEVKVERGKVDGRTLKELVKLARRARGVRVIELGCARKRVSGRA